MATLQRFIRETVDLWQRLQQVQKPIVLYGMGNGADKIFAALEERGIPAAGVFASDGFVRGHSFHGFVVESYAQVIERLGDPIILVAFGTADPQLLAWFEELDRRHELYFPDLPVAGEGLFDLAYLQAHEDEIKRVYALLADESSRRCFAALLNYKLSGKLCYLRESATVPQHVLWDLPQLGSDEFFVDLGAYRGDTIARFLQETAGQYRGIVAMEADAKTFGKLQAAAGALPRTELYNMAAWNTETTLTFARCAGRQSKLSSTGVAVQAASVDALLHGREATYINVDVEGAEREALEGAAETIRRFSPKLLVSVYHRNEDLFAIPLQLQALQPNYRFYLRRCPGVPAWDIALICL